ncbi:hypothetical protein DPMN_013594 [Dreissena polymorpha]|uniref:Uncharacterized protein n=1 Tax=Dreissena polymorpha TaxID=45954 RepID=A0A9D4N5Q2_DREPO|nr:hypothetical protein DPMN_013594 [Dreissena polymorpha]
MIIWINLLFKFSDDRTINVTSRVLTRTIFKLVQDIIRTNLLTKFNGDQAICVASICYMKACLHWGFKTQDKKKQILKHNHYTPWFNTQDNEEQILKHTES